MKRLEETMTEIREAFKRTPEGCNAEQERWRLKWKEEHILNEQGLIIGLALIDNKFIKAIEWPSSNKWQPSSSPLDLIWSAIVRIWEREEPVDWITVAWELKKQLTGGPEGHASELDYIGGAGMLGDLIDHAEQWAFAWIMGYVQTRIEAKKLPPCAQGG